MNSTYLAYGVVGGALAYAVLRSSTANSKHPLAPMATTLSEVDETIERVAANAEAWTQVPAAEKLAMLEEMRNILIDIVDEVGDLSSQLRGFKGTVREVSGGVVLFFRQKRTHCSPPTGQWLPGRRSGRCVLRARAH